MFTWKSIYREISDKLPEYESDNHKLVELMIWLHEQGLKASSVSDRDADGNEIPLDEVDHFSFLANFNRGITNDNRRAIIRAISDTSR